MLAQLYPTMLPAGPDRVDERTRSEIADLLSVETALSSPNPARMDGVDFDTSALLDLYSSGSSSSSLARRSRTGCGAQPLGTTGSVAFAGDLSHMRMALQRAGEQLHEMEAERARALSMAQWARSESSRLTAEVAAMRLGMFTRRIAHG